MPNLKSHVRVLAAILACATLAGKSTDAACPLLDPAACVYVDVSTCGVCDFGVSECTSSAQCTSVCVGFCDDGTTSCVGDGDCTGILSGQCGGACNGVGAACFGDVDCTGNCTGGAGTWNGTQAFPHCQIQAAYDAAQAGDTLLVLPGTYRECVDAWGLNDPVPVDRGVHLVADRYLTQGDNAATIIDATDRCTLSPAVMIGGSEASINGFTVTGGKAAGIFGQGGVVITNNVVTGNSSIVGGGMYIYSGSCYYENPVAVTISGNTVTDNQSRAQPAGQPGERLGDGGGMYVLVKEFLPGSPTCGGADVTIADNTITSNTIENLNLDPDGVPIPVFGGGLFLRTETEPGGGAIVRITQNTISGNSAVVGSESYGGGMFVESFSRGGTENIEITGNTIENNLSRLEGGGASVWVQADGPGAIGDVSMRVAKNTVRDNVAIRGGGGLDLFTGIIDYGGGHTLEYEAEQNLVEGNEANTDDGGGIFALMISSRSADQADVAAGVNNVTPADAIDFLISSNQIIDNRSGFGGAGATLFVISDADPASPPGGPCAMIRPAGATIDFSNNLVAENTSRNFPGFSEVGSGVLALLWTHGDSRAVANIHGSTIVGNQIDFGGFVGGVEVLPSRSADCAGHSDADLSFSVRDSLVAFNDRAGVGGTPDSALAVDLAYTDSFGHQENFDPFLFSTDPTGSNGNISANPLFDTQWGPSVGALYRIASGSPVIDAGDPTLTASELPPTDLDGDDRLLGARVDIGADEFADADGDGVQTSFDNCPADSNSAQADADSDHVGDGCDNCPLQANPSQTNADGDPAGVPCDCNDTEAQVFPGANEINDGLDNQCPGDPGFGAADENSGAAGFFDPRNANAYSWESQLGATVYEAARSTARDFSTSCLLLTTVGTQWVDGRLPLPHGVFYYLHRPVAPHLGSWGLRSDGQERVFACPSGPAAATFTPDLPASAASGVVLSAGVADGSDFEVLVEAWGLEDWTSAELRIEFDPHAMLFAGQGAAEEIDVNPSSLVVQSSRPGELSIVVKRDDIAGTTSIPFEQWPRLSFVATAQTPGARIAIAAVRVITCPDGRDCRSLDPAELAVGGGMLVHP